MIRDAMAMKRDYYDVLGVPRDADDAEIKRAFRKLAQQHHPDVDKGDGAEERFKELNEAYRVLSDRTAPERVRHVRPRRRGWRGGRRVRGLRRWVRAVRRHLRCVLRRCSGRVAPARSGHPGGRPALRHGHRVRRGGLRRDQGDQVPDPGDLHPMRGRRRRARHGARDLPRLQRLRGAASRGADDPRPDGEHRGVQALPRRGPRHRHPLHARAMATVAFARSGPSR